jgi:hypothetical protein
MVTAVRWALGVVVLALIVPVATYAQVTTGEIVGRVADQSGGVLPGATITVENLGTGNIRTTVATASGDYSVTLLPIGDYRVRLELDGFQAQVSEVSVRSGERVRVDGNLALGGLTDTIEVTAEAALLQTDTPTISTLVTESEVQDLPVAGRNFVQLVRLVPGANEGASNSIASGNRPDDRRSTSAVSINGASDTANNLLIDGMDNNERAIGTIGVKPSMDAIAEIRVQTNNYSADVGRTAGGVVNILTKSGTNTLHGSAYGFFRDDRFDERNYFAETDPILSQQQWGGSLGGPIISNRTFFFGDYEGFNQEKGQVNLTTVPTLKMRQGDFSELNVAIYDPFDPARPAFPGNIIPADRRDPVATNFWELYPEPSNDRLNNNWASTTLRTQTSTTADVRIDHRFNDANLIWGRFSLNDYHTVTPGTCPPVNGINGNCQTGNNAGFAGPNDTRAKAFQVNHVTVFNPTTVGEFKAGYLNVGIFSYPANYGTNASEALGLPHINLDDFTSALALQDPSGYALLGDTRNLPLITQDWTYQYAGSLTKTTGPHNLKVGGQLILREFSNRQSPDPVGVWIYDQRGTNDGRGNGGNALASFLLGVPSNMRRRHAAFEPHYHTKEPSVYVQDDWRATSNLTINMGLRYEIFTPLTEEDGQLSNLDLSIPKVLRPGIDGVSDTAGVKTDYSGIGPRTGFAYTATDTLVIRGGYGITYFPVTVQSFALMKNTPLVLSDGPRNTTARSGGVPPPEELLRNGLPLVDAPSAEPSGLTGNFRVNDLDIKSTRTHQFNLQVEKAFGRNVVSMGYVGARGFREAQQERINYAPPGPGAVQPRTPYYDTMPLLTQIDLLQTPARSWYDAFQVVFQRRLTNGLSFNTHYRLAHSEDTTLAPWSNTLLERADSPRDMRHSWVAQMNYALPFGQDLTGVARALLAGWQVNVVANYQTGEPFDVVGTNDRANTGGDDRPNLVGDPELPSGQRTPERWFNTAAWELQEIFTLGNSPRNPLHGPSRKRMDLSVFKDLPLVGNARLQLRYEVYNLFNAVNFANPSGNFSRGTFGSISSTGNFEPRQMQFAAKLIF